MRNLIIAAVAVACIAGASAAQAEYYYRESPAPSWRFWEPQNSSYVNCRMVNELPSFDRADRNDDGYLSGREFRRMGFGLTAFNELDMNNNGVVSRSEVRAAKRACY